MTEDDYTRVYQATGAGRETEATGAHSETGGMEAEDNAFRHKSFRTPTEDVQPPPAGKAAVGTSDYSKLLGIMKQMESQTAVQAACTQKQSEKLDNRLSKMTLKLEEVTQEMEEQQCKLTCSIKTHEV